ncbi:hypothetical protein O5D80_007799 [Batrachochytrium dendrobatidis]|nr:hypothetical protein O5D80_007799 [Batrachochytrium dendrobatidis]
MGRMDIYMLCLLLYSLPSGFPLLNSRHDCNSLHISKCRYASPLQVSFESAPVCCSSSQSEYDQKTSKDPAVSGVPSYTLQNANHGPIKEHTLKSLVGQITNIDSNILTETRSDSSTAGSVSVMSFSYISTPVLVSVSIDTTDSLPKNEIEHSLTDSLDFTQSTNSDVTSIASFEVESNAIADLNSNQITKTTSSDDMRPTQPSLPSAHLPPQVKNEKERFNYASFDCGALVRAVNPEASSATAILSNSKDQYMLNKCSTNKFVEVELCEDILVDTIMLANLEFFSSIFKDFKVYVADRYPPITGWKIIGTFTGENSRERQIFKIDHPAFWARYLRIEFLTHFGQEFYCPLTMLKVYGTRMIEDVKADEYDDDLSGTETILPIVPKQDSGDASLSKDSVPLSQDLDIKDTTSCTLKTSTKLYSDTSMPETVLNDSPTVTSLQSEMTRSNTKTELDQSAKTRHDKTLSEKDEFTSIVLTTSTSGVLDENDTTSTLSSNSELTDLSHTSIPGITPSVQPSFTGKKESIFKNIIKRLSAVEKSIASQLISTEKHYQDLNDRLENFEVLQASIVGKRFDSYKAGYDLDFQTMLELFAKRMSEHDNILKDKVRQLDEKLYIVNSLIESLEFQINRNIIANFLIVIMIMLGKNIIQRILSFLSWCLELLTDRSVKNTNTIIFQKERHDESGSSLTSREYLDNVHSAEPDVNTILSSKSGFLVSNQDPHMHAFSNFEQVSADNQIRLPSLLSESSHIFDSPVSDRENMHTVAQMNTTHSAQSISSELTQYQLLLKKEKSLQGMGSPSMSCNPKRRKKRKSPPRINE